MLNRPSALVLIAANAIPLLGVILFDWRVFDVLLLYWTESVIVGVLNVLRMLTNQTTSGGRSGTSKFFLIPFFTVHYGGFCAAHLFAIYSIFGDSDEIGQSTPMFYDLLNANYWVAIGGIATSHLFSYFSNYIGKGEFRSIRLQQLMQRPYGRILVLQFVVIIGAGLVSWAGSPLPMLMLLIVAKTLLDLRSHNKEHSVLASQI